MDQKYYMGNEDGLIRSSVNATTDQVTYFSPRLRTNLLRVAIQNSLNFYQSFFGQNDQQWDIDKLANQYEQDFAHAVSLDLFKKGGVREKDHLVFWCLGRAMALETYIESGVFIGSSLHAYITCPTLKQVVAIDPNLSQLRIPKENIPGLTLIEDRDFSQLDVKNTGVKTLVYFDDHINTANRIIQASEKNLPFILFDDSTGFQGICQRLYPPIPTIPMIMNCNLLNPGDEIRWNFSHPSHSNIKIPLKKKLFGRKSEPKMTQVSLQITDEFIATCQEAKKRIKKVEKLPNLEDYIPQLHPEKLVDTSKFFLELHVDSV